MERHAKSLKSPLKTCSFAPRISRIYPSAKGDEDLIPWVGIIGVAFCQKILRFTICAVFFFLGFGRVWWFWVTCCLLRYTAAQRENTFFSAEESTVLARFICNNRISNSLCYDKVSGGNFWVKIHWSKGGFQTTLNFQDENLPATLWFHHYPESPGSRDNVWNHLENGPQHKSKGYLSLFQAWFVGRRVKNCPITIKQNQGRQSMDLWQLVLPFHNISGTLCFWPEFERNLSEFLDDGVVINPAGDHFHQLKARMQSLQISRGSPRSPWNFAKFLRNRWKNKTKLSSPKGKEKPNFRENVTGATEQLITRAKHV